MREFKVGEKVTVLLHRCASWMPLEPREILEVRKVHPKDFKSVAHMQHIRLGGAQLYDWYSGYYFDETVADLPHHKKESAQ